MNQSALLVIDVQTGAFDGKATPAIDFGEELLDRVSRLIVAARAAEVPVIYVQHSAHEGQLLIRGTEAWELHSSIKPGPGDLVVHKRASSAFEGTDLGEVLQRGNLNTVIVCGLQSEHCVSNTCLAALERGLDVFVARDAHSTWSNDDDSAETIVERQNVLLAKKGARLKATAEVVAQFSS